MTVISFRCGSCRTNLDGFPAFSFGEIVQPEHLPSGFTTANAPCNRIAVAFFALCTAGLVWRIEINVSPKRSMFHPLQRVPVAVAPALLMIIQMKTYMKTISPKSALRMIALVSMLMASYSAHALPFGCENITMSLPLDGTSVLVSDVSAQDIPGNGLGDAVVLAWLQSDVSTYNNNNHKTLSAPISGVDFGTGDNGVVNVTGYEYAVLHYGKGPGGKGQGGGLVAVDLNGLTGVQTFDLSGSGPNGNGGLSFIRLYNASGGQTVPDGGSTVALFGIGLFGVGMLRRKLFQN